MKKTILITGWVFGAIFLLLFLQNRSSSREAVLRADTLQVTLSNTLPLIARQVSAMQDSSFELNKRQAAGQQIIKDSTNVLTKIDTVNVSLRKIIVSNKNDYEAVLQKKNDSLLLLIGYQKKLLGNVATLKAGMQNVLFKPLASKDDADSSNAAIYVQPFKKSTHKNIFSPQLNFLRVYNQIPNGTINGSPYFDYLQTNDEINQLIFQARSSLNTQGKFQIGAGVELKLNRIGLNGAVLFNPWTGQKPVITIGLREDIYNIRFK